jgi:hypothetical protein
LAVRGGCRCLDRGLGPVVGDVVDGSQRPMCRGWVAEGSSHVEVSEFRSTNQPVRVARRLLNEDFVINFTSSQRAHPSGTGGHLNGQSPQVPGLAQLAFHGRAFAAGRSAAVREASRWPSGRGVGSRQRRGRDTSLEPVRSRRVFRGFRNSTQAIDAALRVNVGE